MPPKSKKEQEEEAARLAEEQRKKEEEEARLALERQKYAAQIISTGLLLPASNQLIIDLYTQSVATVTEKIQQAIKDHCPNLDDDLTLKKLILKETVYYLVEASKIFGLEKVKEITGNEEQFLKARVLTGIAFKVMTHQHKALGGQGKTKSGDQRLVKELLGLHVQKGEGRMKVFNTKDVEAVFNCLGAGYFNHYLLLQHYRTFSKRESQTEQHIYISTPSTVYNCKSTPFEDLSQPNKPEQPQADPQPASE